jgi:hypothetical protein
MIVDGQQLVKPPYNNNLHHNIDIEDTTKDLSCTMGAKSILECHEKNYIAGEPTIICCCQVSREPSSLQLKCFHLHENDFKGVQ